MWHLIPTILYLTYSEAHHPRVVYPEVLRNNDRLSIPAILYQPVPQLDVHNVPGRDNLAQKSYAPYQRSDDPYFDYNKNIHNPVSPYSYSPDHYNLRQAQSQVRLSREGVFYNEGHPFKFDHSSSTETNTDSKSIFDQHSYFEDLELVESFGKYLKKRTQLDGSSSINDPAHQYDALLAVLVALATVIRNSCNDFDQVYDQVYLQTVETYYKYSLNNADKVAGMIDNYIKKGQSHITKLKKLKQETCEIELFCSVAVENKIKNSPLMYVKELETLEALTHLARSYYQYIDEFNQAAKTGGVLLYLQNSKDRLKEYVMHIVNSVEHISDDVVRCP